MVLDGEADKDKSEFFELHTIFFFFFHSLFFHLRSIHSVS